MTAVSRESDSVSSAYTVEKVRDRETIRRILADEQAYSAYALAQLDPRTFYETEWVLAMGQNGSQALLVHSYGGLGPALFAIGDPGALDVAMSLHPGARFSFGSLRLEHRKVALNHYMMSRPQTMQRMQVTAETFTAHGGPATRLGPDDLTRINSLYSQEGTSTAYRPEHLEHAVYCGAFVGGELVSIAGTHAFSANEGVAVVGNVYTHPEYRNRGYASVATSAVTQELMEKCDLVVLTVEANNAAALNVYERLGYRSVCNMHETPLIRKEPVGVMSFARRALATWRGRKKGKEVVVR
jgi:ribosomal protein S18 acetylase RimI-like enzyme